MKAIIFSIALFTAVNALRADHCAPFLTCQQCVSEPLCGWCSLPVVYPGNITGPQCAGFSPNGSTPFACNGIYSTDQCVAGYVCDLSTYTCNLGLPGQGNTLEKCEANCTNDGKVYLCNETLKTCYEVPRGTPGAASYAVCMASCTHPSPHPATPVPPPPQLYACNYTDGKCYPAPSGKGSSLEVCQQNCNKTSNSSYLCNKFLSQCVLLPPGVPGGETYAQCQLECNPKPNPGPQPQLTGIWRGVRIDNAYTVGEFDMSINQSAVVIVGKFNGQLGTIVGKPFYFPESPTLEMWIQVTSGPGVGQTIKTISDASGTNGPETKYFTMALGQPGGPVPASISAAMTSSTQWVAAMGSCISQSCIFSLRMKTAPRQLSLEREGLKTSVAESDHCMPFGDSCNDCLSHEFCGWCSVNVTYSDGSQGSQCAGFNGPNGTNAFVCAGRYSTLSCDQGYQCNYTSLQCYETAPGDGVPQNVCLELCRPTPPPPPPQKQYTCNVTTKQCILCNSSHCPGSMPLAQCEAACTNPKPGPHGNLVGVWRGIRIQNGYTVGEVEMVFTTTNVTYYRAGQKVYVANVTSLGADLMLLTIIQGDHQGWRFTAIYQESTQSAGLYTYITFARSALDGPAPASYDQAMYTQGMEEYIMAKCDSAPCKFRTP